MAEKIIKEGVSYLIPSYNHSEYIIYLLDSILEDSNKTNMNSEIILIDDGSIDNTKEVLSKWEEINNDNISITFLYQENKGLNTTLNKLISLSSYKYLRLCGSDDIIVPGSTAIMFDNFDEDRIVAVSGDGIVIDGNGNKIFDSSIKHHGGRIEKLLDPSLLNSEIILNWCLTGPSTLIKRSHFESVRYDEKEVIDDFFLFLSVIKVNGLKVISEKVNEYRIHDSNFSKTANKEQRIKNQKSFLNGILNFKDMEIKYASLSAKRYLTEAKIAYLETKYIKCSFKVLLYFYFKLRSGL